METFNPVNRSETLCEANLLCLYTSTFLLFILFYSVNYKYKNIKKTKKWAFKKTGYNTGMGGNQKISWCIEQSTREEKWCVNEINFRRPGLILAGMETEEIGPNLLL